MAASAPPLVPRRIATQIFVVQAASALVVGLTFLVCYAGLQRAPEPSHLPVAVAGQSAAVEASQAFGALVTTTTVGDDAAARRAVLTQDTIAGLAFQDASNINLYLAGANGLAENTAAEQLAGGLAVRASAHLHVIDLVPTIPFDPRGLASFYVALSATVGSFILAQAMFALRLITRLIGQLITLAAFAVVIGVSVALVAGPVLHVVPVGVSGLAGVLSLLSLAVSLTSRALVGWFGPAGITIATLMMTAVGLSTSGGILGPDLLPPPLGSIVAVLPPGSAFRAIVSLGYFDGAKALPPLLVLGGWVALSLGALTVHHARRAASPA